jgi:exonuclease III
MTNKNTNLNSFLWNANGLKSDEPELLHLFIEKNIDIAQISETHCTLNFKNFFPGYKVYRADHPDGTAHGGSAIIISTKIHCQSLPNLQINSIQTAKVQITLNHIPTTNYLLNKLSPRPAICIQQVEQFLNSVGNTSLIGGDFNVKHSQWGCRVINIRRRMF